MNFDFTPEQQKIRDNAHEFMKSEILPVVEKYELSRTLTTPVARGLLKKLTKIGWFIGALPKELGGWGMDNVSVGILVEELAWAWLSLSEVANSQWVCIPRMLIMATEAQKKKWLPKLASVEKIICTANSEPQAGSDAAAYKTAAVVDGNYYIVNGTKIWSTGAQYADWCLAMANIDPSKGPKGLRHILVERDVSPYEVKVLKLTGSRNEGISELSFRDCRVPRANLLGGEEGAGYKKQLIGWTGVRITVALQSVGIAQAALEATIDYAKNRHQFNRPIASFQLMQEHIVDMWTEIEAARLLAYKALYLMDKGQIPIKEAAMAKAYGTQAAFRATFKGVQVFGAYGLLEDNPIQRYFRDALCLIAPDGTTEINKLVAGREITGLSAIR